LILLYHSNGDYTQALNTVNRVMKELKKMDDKQLLMEVQLSESKVRSQNLNYLMVLNFVRIEN
jgi:26S proteasome regulatory subunit N6